MPISNPFTACAHRGWVATKFCDPHGDVHVAIEVAHPLTQFEAWGLSNVLNEMTRGDVVAPLPEQPPPYDFAAEVK